MPTTETRLYGELTDCCLSAFDAGQPRNPFALAELLMDCKSVAMHCPEHHFIVPAALLTATRLMQGATRETLEKDLKLAAQRASKVPGGFCGECGCCGAAIGCGIFAAVLAGASPKKETNWTQVNRMTARCLEQVASVGGPRCCKRVTYLSLGEAMRQSPALLGIDLGETPETTCHRYTQSKECRGVKCPYFPKKENGLPRRLGI